MICFSSKSYGLHCWSFQRNSSSGWKKTPNPRNPGLPRHPAVVLPRPLLSNNAQKNVIWWFHQPGLRERKMIECDTNLCKSSSDRSYYPLKVFSYGFSCYPIVDFVRTAEVGRSSSRTSVIPNYRSYLPLGTDNPGCIDPIYSKPPTTESPQNNLELVFLLWVANLQSLKPSCTKPICYQSQASWTRYNTPTTRNTLWLLSTYKNALHTSKCGEPNGGSL